MLCISWHAVSHTGAGLVLPLHEMYKTACSSAFMLLHNWGRQVKQMTAKTFSCQSLSSPIVNGVWEKKVGLVCCSSHPLLSLLTFLHRS